MSSRLSFPIALALLACTVTAPASAATLLVSSAGYTGPTLSLAGLGDLAPLTRPVTVGGITISAVINDAGDGTPVIGDPAGQGGYAFGANGAAYSRPIVGTNSFANTVVLTFGAGVRSFGADFNYAPIDGFDAVLSAYDSAHNLIASYNFVTDAPIDTPDGSDAYGFRGIQTDDIEPLIASVEFTGSYLALAGAASPAVSAVPEPASWMTMILGFGLLGAASRRTRHRAAMRRIIR